MFSRRPFDLYNDICIEHKWQTNERQIKTASPIKDKCCDNFMCDGINLRPQFPLVSYKSDKINRSALCADDAMHCTKFIHNSSDIFNDGDHYDINCVDAPTVLTHSHISNEHSVSSDRANDMCPVNPNECNSSIVYGPRPFSKFNCLCVLAV